MDPYDREPALTTVDQSLTPARLAATAAAGLPAVGLGLLCLSEGFARASGPPVDCLFHLALGAALLVLFGEVALAIHRAATLGRILLVGVLGFAGSFAAAVLTELGGPIVLAGVVLGVAAWASAAALTRYHEARPR
jgi:hypothetical protein